MTHFKKLFLHIFIPTLCILASGCQRGPEPEFLFRASHLTNENHTWFKAFEYFAEILKERSNGRIVLQNYHSEQLAKEIEALRMIQSGIIDMTVTASTLNNWLEITTFCEFPFLLKDVTEMKHLIQGPIGQRMEQEIQEKIGFRTLGYFQRGPRHLTTNRPIAHPGDLKGLIIRVPNVPSFVTAWEALGAKPTPMAFSEVFTSLQQGTIEAQENPFAMIKSAGFSEVQDYVNLTSHVISWAYPIIGEKQFQSLPEDLKQIFLEAAQDMQVFEHRLFLENEKKVQEELKASGMTFVEVDTESFSKKCQNALYESLSPQMQKVYQEIVANR